MRPIFFKYLIGEKTIYESYLFLIYKFIADHINKFDIIVSNPPYIPLDEMKTLDIDVVTFEPNIALYGGLDGLDFYRQIINNAPEFLCEHGKLCFEVGYNQAELVRKLMEKEFCNIKVIKDFNGIDRVVMGEKI